MSAGANRFGHFFQFSTFGESHGPAIGVVIDSCPAGMSFDEELLRKNLERRKPGQAGIQKLASTSRTESDLPQVLSGVYLGKTLGTPIAIIIKNENARSQDYNEIALAPRAGHADDVWKDKFGHADPRGGGRSSGRETAARVMAGSVAQMLVQNLYPEVQVTAFVSEIGKLQLSDLDFKNAFKMKDIDVDQFLARYPTTDSSEASKLSQQLEHCKLNGDSLGGKITVCLRGVPRGLGQPVFRKLKSELAMAVMSIGAFVSFDLGDLSREVELSGTQFHSKDQSYAGIRGGISTGDEISFSAAIKPTSSILDVAKKGRHDPFIGTRAVPVVEAMVWAVLADQILANRLDRLS